MRIIMIILIAILLVGATQMKAQATPMNGTGKVTSIAKDTIKISGITYTLHKNVHVGAYERSGTRVDEVTRSLKSIVPGQEVRYKAYGNMVLELIILTR